MPMKLDYIVPERTAVVVIDMQNDFINPDSPLFVESGYKFADKLSAFLDVCRGEGMEIIYTEDMVRPDFKDAGTAPELCSPMREGKVLIEGTPGVLTYACVAPKDGDVVIKKHRYSGFFGTELDMMLRTMGIDTLILTGVCTDCCVFSTARDGGFLNYRVGVISDLTGTMDYEDMGYGSMSGEEMHRAMMITMAFTTCHCLPSEEFLRLPRK